MITHTHRTRTLGRRRTASIACLLTFLAVSPAAARLPRASFETLVRRADEVVCGEVVGLRSYRAPFLDRGEIIFTDVTVRVSERLVGKGNERHVTIQVPGGRIGDAWMRCAEAPHYRLGEEVVVFLRNYNGARWNALWSHGKYRVEREPADANGTGRVIVRGRRGCPLEDRCSLDELRERVRRLKPESADSPPTPSMSGEEDPK